MARSTSIYAEHLTKTADNLSIYVLLHNSDSKILGNEEKRAEFNTTSKTIFWSVCHVGKGEIGCPIIIYHNEWSFMSPY